MLYTEYFVNFVIKIYMLEKHAGDTLYQRHLLNLSHTSRKAETPYQK